MTKTSYIETNINLSEGQKQKIANAHRNKMKATINFRPENAEGSDTFYFTKGQISRMQKAFNKGHGVNINLSNAQIRYNTKHGGFLPLLLGGLAGTAASSVLPAVLGSGQDGGFLGGLARTALKFAKPLAKPLAKNVIKPFAKGVLGSAGAHVADAILGDGLYLVKRGHGLKLETDGSGLYLLPAAAGLVAALSRAHNRGNGLYLVQDGQIQKGGFLPGILPGAIKGIVDLIT